jgi:hypothetical protein
MVTFHEFHKVSSIMEAGVKLIKMHHAQWLKYGTDCLVLPLDEAEERWKDTLKKATDEEKDEKGPKASPLRLLMCVEEFVKAESVVETGKIMDMETKKAKISDDALKEGRQMLEIGHIAFSDEIFNSVGGASARRLAATGGTFIGARGEGSFGGESTASKYAALAAGADDGKEVKEKKVKRYDVETKSVKLLEYHLLQIVGLKDASAKLAELVSKTLATARTSQSSSNNFVFLCVC